MRRSLFFLALTFLFITPAAAQTTYGTDANLIIAIPTANFGNYFNTGLGGELAFFWNTEEYLRVSVVLGYLYWPINKDAVSRYYNEVGGAGTLTPEGGTGAFPFLVGVKIMSPKPGVKPYAMAEGGIYLYTSRVSGTYVFDGTTQPYPEESSSHSEPAFNLGFGVLFPIDTEISADLHMRYHIVRNSTYANYNPNGNSATVTTSNFLTFALGISYSFTM
jgi:hypothetical protein